MISQIDISGFRSIREAKIPLKKLNILCGQNGSGKSSVMYAPYVFRNFCVNPNQQMNRLFDLGFMNLGGYEDVITYPKEDNLLEIGITVSNEWARSGDISGMPVHFSLNLGNRENAWINVSEGKKNKSEWDSPGIGFSFPYKRSVLEEIELYGHKVKWDGLSFFESKGDGENISAVGNLNELPDIIKEIAFIPVKRGFSQQTFSINFNDYEDKVAYSIKNPIADLEASIDVYVRKIFGKIFRFVAYPRSQVFYLKIQNGKGVTTDLVNEAFGVNQIIYMLIKMLKKSTPLAFVEEPEIHLHPTVQAKLVNAFIEIIENEDKQIFLITHSETIVSSVLAKIAKGNLSCDDVQFYLAKKENDETKIIPQEINNKGQIKGGLINFMETDSGNLKSMSDL